MNNRVHFMMMITTMMNIKEHEREHSLERGVGRGKRKLGYEEEHCPFVCNEA